MTDLPCPLLPQVLTRRGPLPPGFLAPPRATPRLPRSTRNLPNRNPCVPFMRLPPQHPLNTLTSPSRREISLQVFNNPMFAIDFNWFPNSSFLNSFVTPPPPPPRLPVLHPCVPVLFSPLSPISWDIPFLSLCITFIHLFVSLVPTSSLQQ